MTAKPTDHEVTMKCPLEVCPFYSEEQNWHKWRGKVEAEMDTMKADVSTIKKIGMSVVGAIMIQLFATFWSIVAKG